MTDNIKISSLQLENVKRVKAVEIVPTATGLTVIGGKNGQGKTSVLDGIAWALGGEKYRPSDAAREGSVLPPHLCLTLSNGLVVERKGKNSALTVTDPTGAKAGQKLLDSFVGQFALNLPKFLQASNKEKGDTLLQIIGVGDKLTELETEENRLYNERLFVGRQADQKKAHAAEMEYYPGLPDEQINASDLIKQQQEILARNGQRQKWAREYAQLKAELDICEQKFEAAQDQMRKLREEHERLEEAITAAQKSPEEMEMESTEELERNLQQVEDTNAKIRANLEKERATDEARQYAENYEDLTDQIEKIRSEKRALLDNAALPLPGLMVESGELTYLGKKWDCMSGSDQLRVATAITAALNPRCGFVLLDKLEQMDTETLEEFGAWLKDNNLQAIATRVSTGEECQIIIEDGYSVDPDAAAVAAKTRTTSTKKKTEEAPKWQEGVF